MTNSIRIQIDVPVGIDVSATKRNVRFFEVDNSSPEVDGHAVSTANGASRTITASVTFQATSIDFATRPKALVLPLGSMVNPDGNAVGMSMSSMSGTQAIWENLPVPALGNHRFVVYWKKTHPSGGWLFESWVFEVR